MSKNCSFDWCTPQSRTPPPILRERQIARKYTGFPIKDAGLLKYLKVDNYFYFTFPFIAEQIRNILSLRNGRLFWEILCHFCKAMQVPYALQPTICRELMSGGLQVLSAEKKEKLFLRYYLGDTLKGSAYCLTFLITFINHFSIMAIIE